MNKYRIICYHYSVVATPYPHSNEFFVFAKSEIEAKQKFKKQYMGYYIEHIELVSQ